MTTTLISAPRRGAAPRRSASWWRGTTILIGPAIFLGAWALLAWIYRDAVPAVMPAPWSVSTSFDDAWQQGLGSNIAASAEVAAGGWIIACVLALIVGVLVARVNVLRTIAIPVLELLRPISAVAWVPLAVIWFGIGYESKLFIVALATFFIVVINVIQGADAVDSRQLKVARMIGLRRRDVYRWVVVPAALPEITLGFRQGLGVAWGGVIIAELVSGDKGLGAMELLAEQGFQLNLLVVAMVVCAVIGLLAVLAFGAAERMAFPWLAAARGGARAASGVTADSLAHTSSRRVRLGGGVLGIVLFVGIWWAFAAFGNAGPIILPQPSDVAVRIGELFQQSTFWTDFGTSVREFVVGYVVAIAAALVFAIVFVTIPAIHKALWSEIELLRFVIPFSWIPLAVLWFSTSETGKIFIVGYAVFFSTILPIYAALAGVDSLALKAGRMMRLPWWRQAVQIRARSAASGLLVAARVGVGAGWIAVIAAEYVGAQHGLGVFITNAQQTLNTTSVMAGMFVIGVVGAILSGLIRAGSRTLTAKGRNS